MALGSAGASGERLAQGRAREERREEDHKPAQAAAAAAVPELLERHVRVGVRACGAQQGRLAAEVEPARVVRLRVPHPKGDHELIGTLHGDCDRLAELLLGEGQRVLRVVRARALLRGLEDQPAVERLVHGHLGVVRDECPRKVVQDDALARLAVGALVQVEKREVEVAEGDVLLRLGVVLLYLDCDISASLDVDAAVLALESSLAGRLRVEVLLGAGDVEVELKLLAVPLAALNAGRVDEARLAAVRALPAKIPVGHVDEAEEGELAASILCIFVSTTSWPGSVSSSALSLDSSSAESSCSFSVSSVASVASVASFSSVSSTSVTTPSSGPKPSGAMRRLRACGAVAKAAATVAATRRVPVITAAKRPRLTVGARYCSTTRSVSLPVSEASEPSRLRSSEDMALLSPRGEQVQG
eukprot:CAMPEP_0197895234 /NCGR_PEP_ID=MMETSP1439-20131203/36820_1 /TAXON_ID=66791 /ORGANISM="Gonyaulax spinifera, Strain CCMP409" /LENGTH=414 /DNA_ID=CAMNT_0043515657 /DNA_START=40 /DNA_END=1285 /DNA_ORIENTATION=+